MHHAISYAHVLAVDSSSRKAVYYVIRTNSIAKERDMKAYVVKNLSQYGLMKILRHVWIFMLSWRESKIVLKQVEVQALFLLKLFNIE